jgi:hypothetical protein
MIPSFAVVGHPNKGKSSIVATLAEDEAIAIGPTPGTTRRADYVTFTIDGKPEYRLIDTPGFQRAGAVLRWLEANAAGAHDRPRAVREFVEAHRDDSRFHDECELLQPIIEGAGILYVVDGAKPYGAEYELEMQVLQWTGRPRMALINLIGPGDHVDEWRRALGQYFSLVRVFDAVHADFARRIDLLRGFAELDETWRTPIERTVAALEAERERRRRQAAAEIATCLIETAALREERGVTSDAAAETVREALIERLQHRIRDREEAARAVVQGLYRHDRLAREEAATRLLATDLFTEDGWRLFGLSRTRLALTGAASGALAGGAIDAMLGGASLLAGAVVGAVVGGAGALVGGGQLAEVKVLGQSLGGRVMQVGPVSAPNFPWVMLGRAWIHHQLVSERNHARREALGTAFAMDEHAMDQLPESLRRELARCFRALGDPEPAASTRAELTGRIAEVLLVAPAREHDADASIG